MAGERLIVVDKEAGTVRPRYSGEALLLMIGSICWPMVDSYYVVLLFALSLVKRSNALDANFGKDVQWLAETLFAQGKIRFFEACN